MTRKNEHNNFITSLLTSNYIKKNKYLVKILFGYPLTVIAFAFILKYIYSSRFDILPFFSNINYLSLFSGLFVLSLFYLVKGIIWRRMLSAKGYSIEAYTSVYLFSLAEIRRYIPGSIISFTTRVSSFNNVNVPSKILLKTIAHEAVLLVLSAFVVSIPGIIFLFQLTPFGDIYYFLPIKNILITAFSITLILFLLLIVILNRMHLISGSKVWKMLIQYKDTFLISMFGWVLFGIGNLLIAVSFNYFNPFAVIPLASFFAFSWLIGYLSFITPMGLGVREAVIIYGLSYLTPIGVASSLAVILRVMVIFSELFFLLVAFIFYKFKTKIIQTKISHHFAILCAFTLFYIIYFCYFTTTKHINFFTGRFDLGNMDQTVWNTLHGRIFTLTNPDSTDIVSRLGTHADFILILLAPFYIIWSDPRMLLIIQTIVIAIGAIFIYFIANRVTGHKSLSLVLGLSYLLNPFVQKQNLYDFHSITLATTFLLGSFLFLITKRYGLFILFLCMSVLTKENIYLISAIFGIYIFIKINKKFGAILTLFSLVLFYLLISKFIPAARGGEHFAVTYFQEFGDSPTQIVKGILLNPLKTIFDLFTLSNLNYFIKLFSPVGFLSLISPWALFFAVPDLIINFLSTNENFKSITFHYAAAIIPFIYISSIYGIKKILFVKRTSVNFLFYYLLFSSIISAWLYGPLPGSNHPSLEIYTNEVANKNEIHEFINSIPKNLSVSATNNLGAHLSHRNDIYTIPNGVNKADMLLFLLNDPFAQPTPEEQQKIVRSLSNDKNYIQVAKYDKFIAFERRSLLSNNISKQNNDLFPYSISVLQKRSFENGQILFDKTITDNVKISTHLVSYLSDGFRVYSLLSYPKKINPNTPILILAHNIDNKNEYDSQVSLRGLIEHFSNRGYIVFRPDYRGYGLSEGFGDLGEKFSYPIDIINLIFSLDTQDKLLGNKIILLGEELGAENILKVLEVAGKNHKLSAKISKSILINPIYNDKKYLEGNMIGSDYFLSNQLSKLSTVTYKDDILSPVLIVSDLDEFDSDNDSKNLYNDLAENNLFVTFSKVSKIQKDISDEVLRHVIEYINEDVPTQN